ncbi:MAG: heme biosynthesis protein HemY [Alphaproteobacteria bacterium]
MIRLFLAIALLLALAAGAVWLADNPGQVSIAFEGYTVETSAAVLMLLAALLIVATVAVTRIWRWVRKGYWEHRTLAKHRRGYNELAWGLSALLESDGARASRHAKRFEKLVGSTPLADVLAGQAALAQGDMKTARARFGALEGDSRTQALALRGLLAVEAQEGDTQAVLGTARKAAARLPKAEWAQSGLFESALALGDWKAADSALQAAIKSKRIGETQGAHQSAVLHYCQAREASDKDQAIHLARDALKLDPDLIPARALLANRLIDIGKKRKARSLLKEGWRKNPHPDLAKAWMRLTIDHAKALRYKHLQGLTEGSDHPETHAALGPLALDADLPGPARTHIEALVETAPQHRAYKLLATLENSLGNTAAATVAERNAADASPDPSWHCDICGHDHGDWAPLCDGCGAFATLHWGAPIGMLKPPEQPPNLLKAEATPLLASGS